MQQPQLEIELRVQWSNNGSIDYGSRGIEHGGKSCSISRAESVR